MTCWRVLCQAMQVTRHLTTLTSFGRMTFWRGVAPCGVLAGTTVASALHHKYKLMEDSLLAFSPVRRPHSPLPCPPTPRKPQQGVTEVLEQLERFTEWWQTLPFANPIGRDKLLDLYDMQFLGNHLYFKVFWKGNEVFEAVSRGKCYRSMDPEWVLVTRLEKFSDFVFKYFLSHPRSQEAMLLLKHHC